MYKFVLFFITAFVFVSLSFFLDGKGFSMKARFIRGGRDTWLRPLTHTQDKYLIPIANKPVLHYAIEYCVQAGGKMQENPQRIVSWLVIKAG